LDVTVDCSCIIYYFIHYVNLNQIFELKGFVCLSFFCNGPQYACSTEGRPNTAKETMRAHFVSRRRLVSLQFFIISYLPSTHISHV
jgi:hypothetical protein